MLHTNVEFFTALNFLSLLINKNKRLLKQKAVYITEHLPKLFQDERKWLLPFFTEARRLNEKTFWRAENGHFGEQKAENGYYENGCMLTTSK